MKSPLRTGCFSIFLQLVSSKFCHEYSLIFMWSCRRFLFVSNRILLDPTEPSGFISCLTRIAQTCSDVTRLFNKTSFFRALLKVSVRLAREELCKSEQRLKESKGMSEWNCVWNGILAFCRVYAAYYCSKVVSESKNKFGWYHWIFRLNAWNSFPHIMAASDIVGKKTYLKRVECPNSQYV